MVIKVIILKLQISFKFCLRLKEYLTIVLIGEGPCVKPCSRHQSLGTSLHIFVSLAFVIFV